VKLFLKVVAAVVLLVLLGAGGGLAYLNVAYPKVGPPPSIQVEATPDKVARGRYLANHVAVCIDCHSDRDWTLFSGPIIPGTEGRGGFRFDRNFGFPGVFYSKNITPAALGEWTDGEILRAMTSGVSRDGSPFFPVMPYPSYRLMAQDDAEAIVAYLRTLTPIPHEVPESRADFPMNFILRTIPQPASPVERPDPSNVAEYGKYVATIAGCADCHTPATPDGQKIPGLEYAGGMEFRTPWGVVRALNLTPDDETGLGGWDREFFVKRFKAYGTPEGRREPVEPGAFNTVMPWTMYADMTEEDLAAIYEFLRTVPAVKHKVEKHTPLK
jgi:mono/diheme cytochrome c family protein